MLNTISLSSAGCFARHSAMPMDAVVIWLRPMPVWHVRYEVVQDGGGVDGLKATVLSIRVSKHWLRSRPIALDPVHIRQRPFNTSLPVRTVSYFRPYTDCNLAMK